MVHNYYLYEEGGVLSMLPWDYNLAFGGFQTADASGAVNEPIDTPVTGGSLEDRPMAASRVKPPPGPPPMPMVPISLRSSPVQATSAEGSSACL